ncbi:hypothetical protein EVAR_79475_1 [Eumeta japonica]|uniref:Uncharacterized protein n=1 Tax=Eumeta variegata TaxID=151549 RepID=A0A4C1UF39_EUMVA|nr:hypothetical protein EVAR_79475_1 [Eumeta japonica]
MDILAKSYCLPPDLLRTGVENKIAKPLNINEIVGENRRPIAVSKANPARRNGRARNVRSNSTRYAAFRRNIIWARSYITTLALSWKWELDYRSWRACAVYKKF